MSLEKSSFNTPSGQVHYRYGGADEYAPHLFCTKTPVHQKGIRAHWKSYAITTRFLP